MRKSSSRARLFSTCLTGAVLIAAAPAWAQTSEAPTWKPRAEIEAEAGTTVGVSTALWAPLAQNDSGLVYVDGRIGYDQRFERNGSATIGARARVNEDFAIGANAGIDFYRSDIGRRDQAAVSLGLEGFGPVFDVRVNYRMPITRKATISYIDPAAAPAGELLLENNRLIERRSGFRLEEIPLRGFNGEAGVRVPVGRNASLRASIGGFDYWDIRADESHRGGRGGLELDVEDSGSGARFTFGGTVERDNRYGTDARATVRLSIPLGGARGDRGRALTGLDRQMGDRVRRDYVARSGSRFTDLSSDQFAIDARTGQAFGGFYYASGTGTAGAAGTLASPTTIGDAVTRAGANGVVVALGSGGTINTSGVTLATNQYLLGGAGAVDVRLGNGSVTSFALGGTNGTIAGTSAATPTITLGQGSVVRDVTVRGAGTGIAANGVGGFSIDRVVIENTGGAGLSLTNTLGSFALTGLTIRGGAGAGLLVNGGSSVSVANSSISGGAGAVDINDGGANLAVSLSNLTLSATAGNVLDIDGSGAGTVTVTGLSGITIAGGQGEDGGLSVRSATFDASATTAGIQTVNAGRMEVGTTAARVDGPGVFLTDVTGSLSFADLDVANRNATGVQVVNSKVNGFTLATLDGTVDTLGGTAMDLDPLVIDLRFASVRSVGATGHGLILDSIQGGGTGGNALTIGTLTLTDSGGDGLVLVDSTGLVRILGGSISNSGGSAVRVGTQGVAGSGGTIGLSFAGTITDPTGSAPLIGLFNVGGAIGFTGAINGSGGIVVQDSLAGSSANFGNVTLTGTTGPAVLLGNLAGSVAFTGPLTIANPAGNGIVIGNVPGGVSFGSVAISGLGNAVGLDLAGTHGNVTFGSLAIAGTGTGTGINLAGSTNAGNVLIGGAATIQGVTTGVDLTGAD
ncbi:MAG TPA: right-handed parallel beta-helix repeat-containing protein, partial [Sphingomonas sp.]|nr:right-handed parallel beta-helix repeat-containing protein [Sphingomonas sp.]